MGERTCTKEKWRSLNYTIINRTPCFWEVFFGGFLILGKNSQIKFFSLAEPWNLIFIEVLPEWYCLFHCFVVRIRTFSSYRPFVYFTCDHNLRSHLHNRHFYIWAIQGFQYLPISKIFYGAYFSGTIGIYWKRRALVISCYQLFGSAFAERKVDLSLKKCVISPGTAVS